MENSSDHKPVRELLRHTLATIAYRGGKTIRNAPPQFAEFNQNGKTPAKLLAHMGDLLDWALSMANGTRKWHDSEPLPWEQERERFFRSLKNFDDYLASNEPLKAAPEKLFQGPIADTLTHIGQLAMLRRVAGAPITGENYYVAEITAGRVGDDQSAPKQPFR